MTLNDDLVKKCEEAMSKLLLATIGPRKNGKNKAREDFKDFASQHLPQLVKTVKDLRHEQDSDKNLISYLEDEVTALRKVVAFYDGVPEPFDNDFVPIFLQTPRKAIEYQLSSEKNVKIVMKLIQWAMNARPPKDSE